MADGASQHVEALSLPRPSRRGVPGLRLPPAPVHQPRRHGLRVARTGGRPLRHAAGAAVRAWRRQDAHEADEGIDAHFLPSPFRFCLRCGVAYGARQSSDFGKLTSLGSEGRSTATTILSLSAIRRLRADPSLPAKAKKLLSFTDNRQDAALQAGHFNDFVEVGLLRAGLFKACHDAGAEGLRHDELTQRVFAALALPLAAYASDAEVRFEAKTQTERALRDVIGYRIYRDLKRGWRITAPNLEQCGLLEIRYLSLDDVCRAEDVWATLHPVLRSATPETRIAVAKTLLDYMRRELAIKVDYLSPEPQERIQQQSNQRLIQPWALDDPEVFERAAVLYPRGSRGQVDYGGNVYLSPRGGFGQYLRRTATFPEHDQKVNVKETEQIAADLLKALKVAGLVEIVQEPESKDDVPGYQLPASAMAWVSGDGTRAFHDPIRIPRAPEEGLRSNRFFVGFYREAALQAGGIEAREHTAQVTYKDREDREERFRDARLPILYCSPTMELGVDISELNAVNLPAWESVALATRKRLHGRGFLSCDDARAALSSWIEEPSLRDGAGRVLAARFSQVIVDEAQDCGDVEIAVLRWLRSSGVHVVTVCDPQQAIYEFRGSRPDLLAGFVAGVPAKSLTGNFRSTPSICRLAATMRPGSRQDAPLGKLRELAEPVLLLVHDRLGPAVGARFLDRARDIGIPDAEIVVLAHAQSAARRAVGQAAAPVVGTSRCSELAHAATVLHSCGSSPKARVAAVEAYERQVLRWLSVSTDEVVPGTAAEDVALTARWLRRAALDVVMTAGPAPESLELVDRWIARLRGALESLHLPGDWTGRVSRATLPRRPAKKWSVTKPATGAPHAMTVHAAKGREFEAVLLVLRERDARSESLTADWERMVDSDALRVAYVAVTRAKQLVGLAVPRPLVTRVEAILERGGVARSVVDTLVGPA